ncbi:ABC transporter substrate-binding protein [Corynebacterium pseudotuberculosis]|uniref:ABC transporter substrate-binding protein n=1 Tax=Corynebacterium pseudotuberculosis TaxID=1719 RepID=UPI00023246F5|nr:ABC transporter substrate-binding protein [Corynebacterium pseudotuberculosis]AER68388.1 ABC-type transporter [Corynebacterium pseudotuberculosis 1/06-A]AFB71628.1 ABC transporter substrate-binding protein [Corynebacterium pseudotuberculosis 316]AFH90128.1 ABC transporter substrate-binding protein [Corynebacterium pseudotuberculosis 31]AKS12636.1 ABC-type transporter [Corynebacterium pseudotuberculosis]AMN69377.1 ABC transporter substrate-binding protein [Corynebacterium pseudotuberculosis]
MKKTTAQYLALVSVAALALTACGESAADKQAAHDKTAASEAKIQVASCDETLSFNKAPEKVLVMSETDISILHDLDVIDKVVAKAGAKRVEGISPSLEKAIANIPTIAAGELDTGGAKVSTEAILELKPDLVIGFDTGADRQALKDAGIPLYSPDAFCPNASAKKADWGLVNNEIDKLATIFDVKGKGEELKKSIQEKLKQQGSTQGDTSAVMLYITPGSDEFYAYGNTSMVQPILEANGLKNVYADNPERVFDSSMEEILAKNPDRIVLLSESSDSDAAMKTFLNFPGAKDLKAVQNNHVAHMPFILTDPPTTLSVEGASYLHNLIK